MTAHSTDLVRRASVEEIAAHRARATELYGVAVERLKDAMDAHARACQMGGVAHYPTLTPPDDRYGKLSEFVEKMTVRMDRDIWRGIVVGTPIGSLMDREEREAFEKSLDKDPPPATAENVRATLERLLGESDEIFRRGLVNAFKRLDREYASNDGFKIGERIVLTWGVTWDKISNWFTLSHIREAELHDIDRVMHVLDGKPAPTRMQGLVSALDGHMYSRGRDAGTTGETAYWRYRIFKNGNMHLWPLRKDLLDRANRIIAEHYGLVVPAGHKAREAEPSYQPRPDLALEEDFFATPSELADHVVAAADVEPGMKVLEPSAGEGALACAARILTDDVWCVEINGERCDALQREGIGFTQGDFLMQEPEALFDRVVMNPPFSQQQDVRHVLHALRFLRSGGKLVAIMSPSWQHRQDKLSRHFRSVVERSGGTVERLPSGSFKVSGTSVETVLLTIPAP